MLLSFYNQEGIGDVLIVTLGEAGRYDQMVDRRKDVAQIRCVETDEVIGYNFFEISQSMQLEGQGQVFLQEDAIQILNRLIAEAGYTTYLEADLAPKFVVGYVETCVPHEDSDHLSITQVDVGEPSPLQIVCGASNVSQGQRVVVAKIGAMMPSGALIFAGELRGVKSYGMLCSARELGVEGPEKGILVLADDAEVGSAFFQAN